MVVSNNKISLIANEKCWIEGDAIAQLESVATLPGVVRAVGLPDLHPGKTPNFRWWRKFSARKTPKRSASIKIDFFCWSTAARAVMASRFSANLKTTGGIPQMANGLRPTLPPMTTPSENTEDTEKAAFSLSHGAGRKWIRSLCKGRLRDKYRKDAIRETRLGSKTVCHDMDLLYEEAPEAYKGIEYVIDALAQHNLCTVAAALRPLLTVKV
jgi:hypothetical protein